MLKKKSKFAIVAAKGLGDGLLSMILSHNLKASGHDVVTFNPPLCELRRWFPEQEIRPFPLKEQYEATFAPFDELIVSDHTILCEDDEFGNRKSILKESSFDGSKSLVENLSLVCSQQLHLPHYSKENGITPPQDLEHRRYKNRVLIHPMSTSVKRMWPIRKYMTLAEQLIDCGLEPKFCLSHEERKRCSFASDENLFPYFPTLDAIACYVYESGLMIGNNSGIGHLASCLKIPTLSIFARKSYSRLWRPGWNKGVVVTPISLPLGGRLRQRYWHQLLSVKRVRKALSCLYD